MHTCPIDQLSLRARHASQTCCQGDACAANLGGWAGQTFRHWASNPSGQGQALTPVRAADRRVQGLLSALTAEFHASLGATMAEQTAAPVGFVLAGFLETCLNHPTTKCGLVRSP